MSLKVSSVHSRYANNQIEDILFATPPPPLICPICFLLHIRIMATDYEIWMNLDWLRTTNFPPRHDHDGSQVCSTKFASSKPSLQRYERNYSLSEI